MGDRIPGRGSSGASPAGRTFPGAPRWIWWLAGVSFLLAMLPFPGVPIRGSNSGTCARCEMTRVRSWILCIPLPTSLAANAGSLLHDRAVGPCTTHDWRNSGCHYSGNMVSCGPGDAVPAPVYEVCARAQVPFAEEWARRTARLDEAERIDLLASMSWRGEHDVETTEGAREWVESFAREHGWVDLVGQATPATRWSDAARDPEAHAGDSPR